MTTLVGHRCLICARSAILVKEGIADRPDTIPRTGSQTQPVDRLLASGDAHLPAAIEMAHRLR
ncbi:MAG: hypothetical protein CME06_17190 [Gemmatimonadetes bacterium]|nr:hypothetical protein [Gemmatimonadota bacterium]